MDETAPTVATKIAKQRLKAKAASTGKLNAAGRKARSAKLTLRLTVTDAARNARTTSRTITVRR